MDETLERETADEAVLENREAPAKPVDPEPKAFMFDGWGLVPLEF